MERRAYTGLGYVVWHAAKLYLRIRFGRLIRRTITVTGIAVVAGAVGYIAWRMDAIPGLRSRSGY